MELFEKSLSTLELPTVLELLKAQAQSEGGKELCVSLRPSDSVHEIKRSLSETSAAKDLMVLRGSPSFSGAVDVRGAVSRADRGGLLTTRELLNVTRLLKCARQAREYPRDDKGGRTQLDGLFYSLSGNKYLEEKITTAIIAEDEISDNASRELYDIRRRIRLANAKVRETLQKIISSPAYSKALQEPIITTRSGRYVVPVKAESKNAVPGLVHDVSSSGATVFVEPMSVVNANNEIRELEAKEKAEIERILAELSAECASFSADITGDYEILVQLDAIFARAKLSYELDAMEPVISEGELNLKKARHPLLKKGEAVPIDVRLGGEFDTLVITGPNTGGKTVTLKTLGLLSVMAMCGLHIPAADGSCVPVFSGVFADIGDEQSIEQSLSTFSSHMTNIVEVLKHCKEGCLLLFDELGAGTDPTEGAALAISVIENARKKGAVIAATTHYAELKVYATTQAGVANASCEFDVETLRPTYRLLIGVPGKSNAFAISRRLGLPEEVIEDAKSRVSTESRSMEDVIEKLEHQRQLMEKDKRETAKLLKKAEEDGQKAAFTRRELEVRLEKAETKARSEAKTILEDARREAERVFEELDNIRKMQEREQDHKAVNEARAALRRNLNEAEDRLSEQTEKEREQKKSSRPLVVGDVVEILPMGVKATVLSISADRILQLQAGIMKVSAGEDEVFLLEQDKVEVKLTPRTLGVSLKAAGVAPELDIRGMMTDEAIPVLERYIDSAVMGKLETVTIIHGKGTGALRSAVHESLKKNKTVKSFRLGVFGEGETGVTVATLR